MRDALADSYGFDVTRALRDSVSGQACLPDSERCEWRVEFGDWSSGEVNPVTLAGQGLDATDPCLPGRLLVTGTYGREGLIHEVVVESAGFVQ